VLNDKTAVGLDVHGTATQAAVLELATGELSFRRVSGAPSEVVGYLQGLPGNVLATYEAGPMGYGLAEQPPSGGWMFVSAHPVRFFAAHTSGSRRIDAMPSGSRGCWPPVSCPSYAFRASRKRATAISRVAERPRVVI
jgi:hypothetical protein